MFKKTVEGDFVPGIFRTQSWEKVDREVLKPAGFPFLGAKVQIVSRSLSGIFLLGFAARRR